MLYLSLFLTENRASMKKRIVLADDDTPEFDSKTAKNPLDRLE